MEFRIKEKLPQHIDHNLDNLNIRTELMIEHMAEGITDEVYVELCHQLHGTKREFDEVDGECSINGDLRHKKMYTVKSALYRGVFWSTLNELDRLQDRENDNY